MPVEIMSLRFATVGESVAGFVIRYAYILSAGTARPKSSVPVGDWPMIPLAFPDSVGFAHGE